MKDSQIGLIFFMVFGLFVWADQTYFHLKPPLQLWECPKCTRSIVKDYLTKTWCSGRPPCTLNLKRDHMHLVCPSCGYSNTAAPCADDRGPLEKEGLK